MLQKIAPILLSFILLIFLTGVPVLAQSTGFTYQGKLTDGAAAANGNYDFEFKLYAVSTGGSSLGTQTKLAVAVTNGIFTVQLDFGTQFDGSARFLEIGVKPAGSIQAYTTLAPRQPITATPYAVRSLIAGTATNATQLGGVPAAQFVQMDASGNVSVSGDLSVGGTFSPNIVNAQTEYQIGSQRVFKADSNSANTFAGLFSGQATTGTGNAFFGYDAGRFNTAGFFNSFFGFEAGRQTTTGDSNSFFGTRAGHDNTTGIANSFFGREAGYFNTTGNSNSFFGNQAGFRNTSGANNAFFGNLSGGNNTNGSQNAIFGYLAGQGNTTGNDNSFFGYRAGQVNSTGERNSFFGSSAGGNCFTASCPNLLTGSDNAFFGFETGFSNTTGAGNAFFGANAGHANTTGASNSFFGLSAGQSNTNGSANSFFGRGSGLSNTTGASNAFFGWQSGASNTTGQLNSFFGYQSGFSNIDGQRNSFFGTFSGLATTTGNQNAFFGYDAGINNTTGTDNTFFGRDAGNANTTGSNNTLIGALADVASGNLDHATAIGADALASLSNSIYLGRASGADAVRIPGAVLIDGSLVVHTLGSAGSAQLCLNAADRLAPCSSSLRYKTHVKSFLGGLDVVHRLRPITFDWKESGMPDIGFAAEEVNEIEPRLATHNKQGEIEGVKYNQLTTVLVNAVKEQQAQIEAQQKEIAALKKLICLDHPEAEMCKP